MSITASLGGSGWTVTGPNSVLQLAYQTTAATAAATPYQGRGVGLVDENGAIWEWTGTVYAQTGTGGGGGGTNPEGTVVAAGTTNLATSTSENQTVSGSTTITAFGTLAAGTVRKLVFTGSPKITYNATSLLTPTGLDIQAAPGDSAVLVSLGSGNWRIYQFLPFNALGRLAQSADVTAGRDITAADFYANRGGVMVINSASVLAFLLPTVAVMGLTGSGNVLPVKIKGAGIPTFAGKTSSTTINGVAGSTTVLPAGGAAPVQYSGYVFEQRGTSDVWDFY